MHTKIALIIKDNQSCHPRYPIYLRISASIYEYWYYDMMYIHIIYTVRQIACGLLWLLNGQKVVHMYVPVYMYVPVPVCTCTCTLLKQTLRSKNICC